jgi:hypothetical protein
MDALNVQLEVSGAPYRAAVAEYTVGPGGSEAGNTVRSMVVGNKHLTADFPVRAAPRVERSGDGAGGRYHLRHRSDGRRRSGGRWPFLMGEQRRRQY